MYKGLSMGLKPEHESESSNTIFDLDICKSSVMEGVHCKIMSSSATSHRKCRNSPDSFCYICGNFTIPS
ncbi:Hypothetical predicted protein [Octopus vulgaris]|uniref:Uncharacterized protein n=1 Tax=Octopus vulgaris TaxID=6645 RepID=A0AA36AK77_OCTVU|nr:Hypothetical predicted protein [Octopus vulgaris]